MSISKYNEMVARMEEASIFKAPSGDDPRVVDVHKQREEFEGAKEEITRQASSIGVPIQRFVINEDGIVFSFILTGQVDSGHKDPMYYGIIRKGNEDRAPRGWISIFRFTEDKRGTKPHSDMYRFKDDRGAQGSDTDWKTSRRFEDAVKWVKGHFSSRERINSLVLEAVIFKAPGKDDPRVKELVAKKDELKGKEFTYTLGIDEKDVVWAEVLDDNPEGEQYEVFLDYEAICIYKADRGIVKVEGFKHFRPTTDAQLPMSVIKRDIEKIKMAVIAGLLSDV